MTSISFKNLSYNISLAPMLESLVGAYTHSKTLLWPFFIFLWLVSVRLLLASFYIFYEAFMYLFGYTFSSRFLCSVRRRLNGSSFRASESSLLPSLGSRITNTHGTLCNHLLRAINAFEDMGVGFAYRAKFYF